MIILRKQCDVSLVRVRRQVGYACPPREVYGHTTTAMHDNKYTPRSPPPASILVRPYTAQSASCFFSMCFQSCFYMHLLGALTPDVLMGICQ